MKFFLDTVKLDEIKKAKELGFLDGVTTNPSLISKGYFSSKNEIFNHYISICNILENGDISAEVIGNNYDDIIQEGEELSSLNHKIVVKVPMTKNGIRAIKFFSKKNISTNCTLVFSLGQAILAAKVGAKYVSPFVGRLDDISYNGLNLIKEIKNVYNNYGFQTKILAASIRNPLHILECSKIGIYAVTSPINIILSLFHHPMTEIGLDKFIKDYNKKIN
ncbi:fructose-6-phosphate aldolase [Blattabacterium cuenoti]|uniref:fructose-6-phosphate aldolase n=1 Tax=Blattabacterium cuenoti TaxID=1653831 RepID=UPI00163BDBF7|nr:fructose-6-phosphate aldolase [Blattabacterium cuenoti]